MHRVTAILLASTAVPGAALAQVGQAETVNRQVDATGPGGSRPLEVQGAVFMGDELVSNPHGLAQIRFADDTKMVLGPNAQLKIDRFLYDPNRTAEQVTIDVLKGSFRFISGNSPSEAYRIRTSTMVIGMRGSAVDCAVANDGRAICAALDGTISACDRNNTCASFDNCTVFATAPGGQLGTVEPGFTSQQTIAAFFPFINDQSALSADFRLNTDDCESGNPRFVNPPSDATGDNDRPERDFSPTEGKDDDLEPIFD